MGKYICGHCPEIETAFRSDDERDVRIHITNSKDAHHEGVIGNSPESIILTTKIDLDSSSLITPLYTFESVNKQSEKIFKAALKYPHLSISELSRLTGYSHSTITKYIEDSERIMYERQKMKLSYFKEDSIYNERELTINPLEKKIVEYAQKNPEKTADDLIKDLEISLSSEEVIEICETKITPGRLPEKQHTHNIIMEIFEYADENDIPQSEITKDNINISHVQRKTDVSWETVKDTILNYPIQSYEKDKLKSLKYGDKLEEEYKQLQQKEEKPILQRQESESGNVKFRGVPIDARMQHISERPVQEIKETPKEGEEDSIKIKQDKTEKETIKQKNSKDDELMQVEEYKFTDEEIIYLIRLLSKHDYEQKHNSLIKKLSYVLIKE